MFKFIRRPFNNRARFKCRDFTRYLWKKIYGACTRQTYGTVVDIYHSDISQDDGYVPSFFVKIDIM